MPQRRRNSGASSNNSNIHQPPKKRRITEPETANAAVALDPNAIDHSLDLVPPDAVGRDPSHLDSFSLSLFEDELNVATEAVLGHHPGNDNEEEADVHKDEQQQQQQEEHSHETTTRKKKKQAKRRHSGQQTATEQTQQQPPVRKMDIEEIKQKYGKARLERIRRQAIKDAWKEYREETSRVLQQLPEEITSMFGQVGYGKFGKKWFPLLCISPFDVALESVRTEWYGTFERALEGRIKFAHCGYWVGETNYSPVGPSNFVPCDKATSAHTKLVDSVKKKIEKGTLKLKEGTEEAYLVRAIEEVDRLMNLDPVERRRCIPHTRHPFEDMPLDEVLKDMQEKNISVEAFENDISDDEGWNESLNHLDNNAEDFDTKQPAMRPPPLEEPESTVAASAEQPRKRKKKKKDKPKEAPVASTDEMAPQEMNVAKSQVGTGKAPAHYSDDDSELELDDEDFPSDDDKGDDDYNFDVEMEPRNMAADEGLEDDLVRHASAKPRKKKAASANKAATKKVSEKTKKSIKNQEIPPEQKSEKQKREWLQRRFKRNEKVCVPMLEALHAVNDGTASKTIHQLLSELNSEIGTMCWVFIELHKVPSALKPAKKELKSRDEDFSIVAELRGKMKTQYEQNKLDYALKYSPTTCETSYLGGGKAKKTGSGDVKSKELDHRRDDEERNRKITKSMGEESEKGTQKYKRDSIDSQSGEKKRKSAGAVSVSGRSMRRDLLDVLSPDRGMKSRESSGSLSRLEKLSKTRESAKADVSIEKSTLNDGPFEEPLNVPLAESVALSSRNAEKRDSMDSLSESGRGKTSRLEVAKPADSGVQETTQLQAESDNKSPVKSRPKFSLVGLMKPGSKDRSSLSSQAKQASRPVIKAKKQQLPSWMCNEATIPSLSRNRLYGLEFYKEMTRHFPAEKVNRESMAIALEAATYDWASGKAKDGTDSSDIYWRKVRAIVAVVSGKYDPGSLKQKILKGDFARAFDLVKLPEEKLAEYLKNEFGFP